MIRAVVLRATMGYGYEVIGIHEATQGLMKRPVDAHPLTPQNVQGILHLGGTILRTTNRGDPFAYVTPEGVIDRSPEVIAGYRELGLDALIVVGGDGSLALLRRLAEIGGWRMVAIPKTIDNDVDCTEAAVGFRTAVGVATEAVDRLHVTAASHNRVMILEVMGRDAGHLALHAGIAGGADVILIPEIPFDIDKICDKINQRRGVGRNFDIIVAAEAARPTDSTSQTYMDALGQVRYGGVGQIIAHAISQRTGAETRVTVLGHIQRGGGPAPIDRVLASALGVAAVDRVAAGRFDRMIAWQNRQITDVPLEQVCRGPVSVNLAEDPLVHTARGLGISLGN